MNHTNFFLNLSYRLDLRSFNEHVALQNMPIYYTWENIRQQYKDSNLKMIVQTWNDEFFALLGGSFSSTSTGLIID